MYEAKKPYMNQLVLTAFAKLMTSSQGNVCF